MVVSLHSERGEVAASCARCRVGCACTIYRGDQDSPTRVQRRFTPLRERETNPVRLVLGRLEANSQGMVGPIIFCIRGQDLMDVRWAGRITSI